MQSAASEHGLQNVAQTGNEEPQRRARPCQQSRLRAEEGKKGRNESHDDAERVGNARAEVVALFEQAFPPMGDGHEAVREMGGRAAERDDVAARGTHVGRGDGTVAVVAHHGVFRNGRPFGVTGLAEVAQTRNSAYKGLQP